MQIRAHALSLDSSGACWEKVIGVPSLPSPIPQAGQAGERAATWAPGCAGVGGTWRERQVPEHGLGGRPHCPASHPCPRHSIRPFACTSGQLPVCSKLLSTHQNPSFSNPLPFSLPNPATLRPLRLSPSRSASAFRWVPTSPVTQTRNLGGSVSATPSSPSTLTPGVSGPHHSGTDRTQKSSCE